MHFHVKMLEKGRNDILRDKQTTKKVAPIFSDVKVIYGTITIPFLDSVKKQGR